MELDKAYSIVGLKQYETLEEVNRKYRKLALILHPDKGGNAVEFNEMKSAYETIIKHKEDEKKKEYLRDQRELYAKKQKEKKEEERRIREEEETVKIEREKVLKKREEKRQKLGLVTISDYEKSKGPIEKGTEIYSCQGENFNLVGYYDHDTASSDRPGAISRLYIGNDWKPGVIDNDYNYIMDSEYGNRNRMYGGHKKSKKNKKSKLKITSKRKSRKTRKNFFRL